MVSFNDGTGTFAPARPIHGLGAVTLAGCVDVDGDGDRDLVGGRTIVFNPGEIRDALPILGGHADRYDPLHDADGDGDLDQGLGGNSSYFGWQEAQQDGTFVSRTSSTPGGSSSLRGTGLIADFDGDGDVDVLMEETAQGTARLRLYRNFGGVFGAPVDAGPQGLSAQQTSTSYGGNGISWANHWQFVADWDGDGDPDGIVVDESHSWTRLLKNDGAGWFTSGPQLPNGYVVTGVGDLDGDGRPDLLAGLAGSLDQLYWLPGTAQGFGAPALLSAAVQRDERPGLVDIDGDGDLDILSSSPAGGLLLRNHGGGQFVAEAHAFASYRLVRWTFGDVDGNGTLDAIAQQPYLSRGRTSAIVLQDPNGTFAAPLRLAAAIDALHDVDLDGDLDALGAGTVFNRSATGSFGRLRQFGQGTPGHYNVRPRINDLGVTAPGKPMTMRVSGMRGAAAGLWVLGFGDAAKVDDPLPGLTLYVDQIAAVVPFVAGGPPGAPGAGEWVVPWTMIGGLGGVALSSQAFCADAAAPNGWTQTNGKVLVLPN